MEALFILAYLAVVVVAIAGMWKAFAKTGAPGWGALVPIYNIYLMTKMAGRPAWWILLLLVPLLNIVVSIVIVVDIAAGFAKSGAFAAGMIFLGFIFWPILGFGDATWRKAPIS